MSLTNNPKPNFFFIADSKTCWVFWGFEQLSSASSAGDIPMQTAGFSAETAQQLRC